MIEIPLIAAQLVLEEFARQDLKRAKPYIGLPRVLKADDGLDWQVAWQEREVQKVMREGLSEADQKRFHEGVIDTTLYTTQKVGQRGVRLTCRGSISAGVAKRNDIQRLLDDYAGKERTRRQMERFRGQAEAAHWAKYNPERFKEEKQTPPEFVCEDQGRLDELTQECKAMELLIEGLRNQPDQEKVTYFFPEGEPPRFVIV